MNQVWFAERLDSLLCAANEHIHVQICAKFLITASFLDSFLKRKQTSSQLFNFTLKASS